MQRLTLGNLPTCRAAEGSSNPGSFGATTSGLSESAWGAIYCVSICSRREEYRGKRKRASSFFCIPADLEQVRGRFGCRPVGFVSRQLPDSFMGRGGVIYVLQINVTCHHHHHHNHHQFLSSALDLSQVAADVSLLADHATRWSLLDAPKNPGNLLWTLKTSTQP